MNPVAETLTGWEQGDALGRHLGEIFRLVDAETRDPIGNPVLNAFERGGTVTVDGESLLIKRDGTEVAIDDSAAVIVDDQGNRSPPGPLTQTFIDILSQYCTSKNRFSADC